MKAGGSHIEGINVGETMAPSNKDDHLTPKGSTVLILLAGILWALINANMVHAGEQQLGKTGLLQALAIGLSLSLRPSVKKPGVNYFLQKSKGSKKFCKSCFRSKRVGLILMVASYS
jgi:hypothetical protein